MTVANGQILTECRITIPWRGPAIVEARAPEELRAPGGLVSFLVGDLALTATLVPERSGTFSGAWRGLAVAGRAGWHKPISAKGYRSPAGLLDAQIYLDAAIECGELAPLVATPQPIGGFYARAGGAGRVASDVFELLGPFQDWWINAAGVTVVGTRLPSLTVAPFDLLDWDPGKGRVTIATDSPAAFAPGVSFVDPLAGSFTVNSVVWTSTASKLRGEIWTA